MATFVLTAVGSIVELHAVELQARAALLSQGNASNTLVLVL
jgi:hypothetical protein